MLQPCFIATLILAFVVGAQAAEPLKSADFTPAEQCGTCHQEIYQQWRGSMHSRAATDSVFWKFYEQAWRDTRGEVGAACLTCHTPVATVTKELRPTGRVTLPLELSLMAKDGVTCDFCHTIAGNENFGRNIGLGMYRYPRRGDTQVKYGTHADAVTPAHGTGISAMLRQSDLCAICHKFTHPVSGFVVQDTYAEWKAGPYAREGRTCQGCHMPEYTGSSATNSPVRRDLSAHVFPGGHTDMVKKAATVTLWAKVRTGSNRSRVQITGLVINSGSGHLLPSGLPGIRELWLEMAVRDGQGVSLATQRFPFGVELLGADGKPAMFWNATRLGKDTRIGPRKSRESELQWTPARTDFEPVDVVGTLYYRLISESAAQAAGLKPSPPIPIASDLIRISSDGQVERKVAPVGDNQ